MAFETPKTWKTGNIVTAALLNTYISGNQTALKAPPTDTVNASTDVYLYTASTYTAITGMDLNITTTGGDIMFWFSGSAQNGSDLQAPSGSNAVFFDIYNVTAGAYLAGNDGVFRQNLPNSTNAKCVSFTFWLLGLAAGEYDFNLRWKALSAHTTFLGTSVHSHFGCREIS